MFGGVNPRQMQGMMKKMGIAQEEIPSKRVIIEKPFGYDLQSAVELKNGLLKDWTEEQIFRIDHYLGKDLAVQMKDLAMKS